jgi:hypothetical protein
VIHALRTPIYKNWLPYVACTNIYKWCTVPPVASLDHVLNTYQQLLSNQLNHVLGALTLSPGERGRGEGGGEAVLFFPCLLASFPFWILTPFKASLRHYSPVQERCDKRSVPLSYPTLHSYTQQPCPQPAWYAPPTLSWNSVKSTLIVYWTGLMYTVAYSEVRRVK